MIDEYAESDEGQFLFHLFCELGITPNDWRNLDPRDARYLVAAYSVKNRREHDSHRKAERKARAQELTRGRR